MTLYIDIENKKLVQSIASDRSVASPTFMQGDNEPLEIHLLEKGDETLYKEKVLTVGTDFLRIAIARFKGYPKALTYANGYQANDNGGVIITMPLNTTAIEVALQDSEYTSAFFEVEYSNIDGKIITILQIPCRIKNDLIENAPAIELQDEFYDKEYVDQIFSKKSANLSDLADKQESRTNLEVYSKSEIDSQEALNLKKANNLSDVADVALARQNLQIRSAEESDVAYLARPANFADLDDYEACRNNLDVPQKRELVPLSFSGVYADGGLNIMGTYGNALCDDLTSVQGTMSFMTTFLVKKNSYVSFFSHYYADYGAFLPSLSADGKTLSLGQEYIYDEETYESTYLGHTLELSKAFEYGDKFSAIVENRILKVYKNIELVGTVEIPSALSIYNPMSFLSWQGLKCDLLYSNSLAFPLTSAQGKTLGLGYSVEDFVNDIPPPKKLFSSQFTILKSRFTNNETISGYNTKGVGGNTFAGVSNTLKIYPTAQTYSASREFNLSSKYFNSAGTNYRIKCKVYIPSANAGVKKIQLRIGNYALSSGGTIISKTDNIDNSGNITTLDTWLDIDVTIRLKNNGTPKFYLYKGGTTNFTVTDENADSVYLANYYIYGLQSIGGYFYGGAECGIWKNLGCSIYDIDASYAYSYPRDTEKCYRRRINVNSFSNSIYEYFDSFPQGFTLTQVVLTFDSSVSDTSNAEDEYSKNIFKLNFGGSYVCEAQIPALNAKQRFNIFIEKSLPEYFYNLEISAMYACNTGGTIDLIFTKID